MPGKNEAFLRVRIDAQLKDQDWDVMEWVRHRDCYEPAPGAKAVPAAGSCCAAHG